jgi:hypothetical protein
MMKRTSQVAVLFLALLTLAGMSAAQVTFSQTAINSGDTGTSAIAAGDFNNNGVLDLVTANTSTLSFYKGLGRGKFASPVNQTMAWRFPGQIVVGDFNRDGNVDLAIATGCCSAPGGVTILLGNGDGTFKQGTNITVSSGHAAVSLAIADYNGDHLPDLAIGVVNNQTFSGTTKVYLGKGDGTFKLSSNLSDGGFQMVAGDFNADGHQDLAMISGHDIAMYLGKGNGTFKSPILTSLSNVSFLAVGDFYNNRIQSIAALVIINLGFGNYENDLYAMRFSEGKLLVSSKQVVKASTVNPYTDMTAGDLNGDFKDDLFLVGGSFQGSAVSAYLLGNGNGTFQTAVSVPPPLNGSLGFFPFVRDLNLDSRHDVGIAWTNSLLNIGGEETLINNSAKTNCTPPAANALSVHICAPTSGQVVGKTFTFKGAGNAWNGVAKRMELWIDGKKIGQNLEDQLNVKAKLSKGSHTASFVVVNSFDEHVSRSVSFTSSY